MLEKIKKQTHKKIYIISLFVPNTSLVASWWMKTRWWPILRRAQPVTAQRVGAYSAQGIDGTSNALCMETESPRCQQDHHTLRQRGLQEKGKYGQVCNKKRERSWVCVTRTPLKIFGELMAESSLLHLQLAEPSGCYKMGKDPSCPALRNTHWARAGWAAALTLNSDLPNFGSSPIQLSTP